MAVLNPKGLTAAVIATTAAETVPHGTAIKNVVFSVILFSIVITSVLVPLIEKKKSVNRFYSRLLGLKTKMKPSLRKPQMKIIQKRNKK